jgi:hypothetical protein
MALGYPNRKSDSYLENGWVFLNGELDWNYQKKLQNALINLIGITGITNNINVITIKGCKQKDIEIAIERNTTLKGYYGTFVSIM